MIIKYIILVLFSTIIGAISGLGGGVIIKPFMDLFGDYDALTISALTSFIVLSMAVISVIKQSLNKKDVKLDIKNTALLGIGSVAGGYLGQIVLEALVNAFSDSSVKIVQNILMIIMVVVIFLYFIYKDRVKNLKLKHFLFFIFGGIFLGMFATVLGIGGGPLNVVLLMVMFDMNIKTAVVGSLVTKLFSQLSKLLTMALSAGFAAADLTLLPYLIAAAIIGAYLGSVISKKCSDRAVAVTIMAVQGFILALAIYNIAALA